MTVEILSDANYSGEGRALLEHKRELLGWIGGAHPHRIDPKLSTLTVWENRPNRLVVTGDPIDHYTALPSEAAHRAHAT